MKICLACNAGGHFLEMQSLLNRIKLNEKTYFVTTKKIDTDIYLKNKKRYFVNETNRSIFSTLKNFIQSFFIFLKEKPDLVISTGAGGTLATCLIAYLFKKKVYYIESFARHNDLSLTGKILYRFSDRFYVQSESLKKNYPKAEVISPLINFSRSFYIKKNLIFVSVGLQKFQFNRLLKALDKINVPFEIIAQTGYSDYVPKNYTTHRFLSPKEIEENFQKSKIAIVHGGLGSILHAINYGCYVIVVPRLKLYKEHVDDHQIDLIQELEKEGKIKVILDLNDLEKEINKVILEVESNGRLHFNYSM